MNRVHGYLLCPICVDFGNETCNIWKNPRSTGKIDENDRN